MSNTIGKFGYEITKMPKSGDFPFSPFVHVQLQNWSSDGDNVPTISPQLMTDIEIDERISALQRDLDSVGKRAKAALKKAQIETLNIVRERNKI